VTVFRQREEVPPLTVDGESKVSQLENRRLEPLLVPLWHVLSQSLVCEPIAFCDQKFSILVAATRIWVA